MSHCLFSAIIPRNPGEASVACKCTLSLPADKFPCGSERASPSTKVQNTPQDLALEKSCLFLDISNALVSIREIGQLFAAVSALLRRLTQHAYSQIVLRDPKSGQLIVQALDFPKGKGRIHEGLIVSAHDSPAGRVFGERRPLVIEHLNHIDFPSDTTDRLLEEGVRSICLAPLVSHDQVLGVISIGSSRIGAFGRSDADVLGAIAPQVALAIENALAFEKVHQLNRQLATEKSYLEEAVETEAGFEDIIGNSRSLKDILQQAALAAASEATVLIIGETGTGKELIARDLHRLSSRRDRMFVKVNCAAIPAGLLESEFFGHERGAFTGAIAQRIGRFELAHGGTLFLDEIGELPLELQPKLLRALQEKAFERVGGKKTLEVDVRLVAATNRDLRQMVEVHQFRDDLFYRLSVFPLFVPPLRDRKEDIPVLVNYFVSKYARLMGKKIRTIPAQVMRAVTSYSWPGNIRELENFIERSLILSRGPVLNAPCAELLSRCPASSDISPLETMERQHITRALKASNWVIGGQNGAAVKLGLKRTTLNAKIRKLGIKVRGAHDANDNAPSA